MSRISAIGFIRKWLKFRLWAVLLLSQVIPFGWTQRIDHQQEVPYRIQVEAQSLTISHDFINTNPEESAGFNEIPPWHSAIRFENTLNEDRSIQNQVLLNGSGVALGDVTGDGLPDIYLCGLDATNRLYQNLGGWHFVDITESAGVGCAGQDSTSGAFADVDGDGDLDLLVGGLRQGVRLFLNSNGSGVFQENTQAAGLNGQSAAASLAIADVDGDGWLDLYLVNYRNDTIRDMINPQFTLAMKNGRQEVQSFNGKPATHPDVQGRFTLDSRSGILENGEPDILYLNQGKGFFKKVEWSSGRFTRFNGEPFEIPYDWGLSAMFHDWNQDGAPDLYVCNDFQSPDRIWVNDGKGYFQEIQPQKIRQTSLFSMGVDFSDVNGDGLDDIFVADMLSPDHSRRHVQIMGTEAFSQYRNTQGDRPQSPRNTLLVQQSDGSFSELARYAGLEASDWSWCPMFLDVDLDGWEDLIITTGHWRDAQHADIAMEIDRQSQNIKSAREKLRLRKQFPLLDTSNLSFRNLGNLNFERTEQDWGLNQQQVAQGMASADLDGDGDLDLVVNVLNGRANLLENRSSAPRLQLKLVDLHPNTQAIGATVTVQVPGLPDQRQSIAAGGRYLSSDDIRLTFAMGKTSASAKVRIQWRDGHINTMESVKANQFLTFTRTDSKQRFSDQASEQDVESDLNKSSESTTANAWMKLTFDRIRHVHQDNSENDFESHPLLPEKISDLGPGLAIYDFNQDGAPDLLIGGGTGGSMEAFRNDGSGKFIPQKARLLNQTLTADQTSIHLWRPAPDEVRLLSGFSPGSSSTTQEHPNLSEWSLMTGARTDWNLPGLGHAGPICMADLDRDGDLDLFIGSRIGPGKSPWKGQSWILKNSDQKLQPAEEYNSALSNLGCVTGALWTDLNQDGWPDLITVSDWGPIHLLINNQGKLQPLESIAHHESSILPIAPTVKIRELTGRWTSLASGDFNNDGRMDLVLGNRGLNQSYQPLSQRPIRHYVSNSPARSYNGIETYWNTELQKELPIRDLNFFRMAFPELQRHFPTFTSFSLASAQTILESLPDEWKLRETSILHSILLTQNDSPESWNIIELPVQAQWSPVQSISTGDLDLDGDLDMILAQNNFGEHPTTSRQDAGQGLALMNNGQGKFKALDPLTSGLRQWGAGRGSGIGDFDNDNQLDWIVTQNNGQTQIYENQLTRTGVSLNISGSKNNPDAIGMRVRATFSDGTVGPTMEVQSGSGTLSQNLASIILGTPDNQSIQDLKITWPDGTQEQIQLSGNTNNFIKLIQP